MPFFRSGALPGNRVDVYLPEQGVNPEELLARAISPPHFPIRPKQLGDGWTFNAIEPGHYEFEGFSVDAREIPHKGGRTFGYRVSDGSTTLAYLPDHSPISLGPGPDGTGVYHDAAITLAEGADLLVHDSQHTAAELPRLGFLGHSAVEYAIALAQRAHARQLALFHHDPWRTDAEIDALVAQHSTASVRVFAAHDGMVMDLPLPCAPRTAAEAAPCNGVPCRSGSATESAVSRWVTSASAAALLMLLPVTATRNVSRSRARVCSGWSAMIVAVRGTPRSNAISPKQSPGASGGRGSPRTLTAADPATIR